jgi:epoxyqueuosine reductase
MGFAADKSVADAASSQISQVAGLSNCCCYRQQVLPMGMIFKYVSHTHKGQFNVAWSGQQQISSILEARQIDHWGLAAIENPLSLTFYKTWLAAGYHGEMAYLEDHLRQKENPDILLPQVRSAIVVAFSYFEHPRPLKENSLRGLRVARYAQGEDYHIWLKAELDAIILKLKEAFPSEEFLAATDSRPVLERDLAFRAGLGWFGKNTCLIDQKRGSFFLLGEILSTLTLPGETQTATALHPDRCGTCTRCIDACPTQAILEPKKLDARKCISYLTIESKNTPPVELRAKMGDHFFGCDICQTVCPWNEKAIGPAVEPLQSHRLEPTRALVDELTFILTTSNKKLERHFANSPLSRARGFGLKRNAIVVAANQNLTELQPHINALIQDPRLGELAKWALSEMS